MKEKPVCLSVVVLGAVASKGQADMLESISHDKVGDCE